MVEHELPIGPKIVTSPGLEDKLAVDAAAVGEAMTALGISSETIHATSILADDTSRITTRGMTFPGWLGRLRHPQLRHSRGPVVRISTVIRGAEVSEEDMNKTLEHELEHVAQAERKDPKMLLGFAAIVGLGIAGGIVGNRLSRKRGRATRVAATVVGAALGQQIGYQLAPHERQARERSTTTKISAIKRR